jgi:excisionase family DNA binding protein
MVARVRAVADTYLTTTEAANAIGVHPNTLRGYADQGLIAHVRLPGGHRRFTHEAVESFKARLANPEIPEPTEEQVAALRREYGE